MGQQSPRTTYKRAQSCRVKQVMRANIYIARHGQNEDNANGLLNGHRDLPLTELGRDQARQLGEGALQLGLGFAAIYSSPLGRAYETAQIVSDTMGLHETPTVLDEIIERDFGIMTGRPYSDIEPMCAPDIIKTDTVTYFLNPDGAETFPQLVRRGELALNRVKRAEHQDDVLLVCHGDIGKMIFAAATGRPWQDVLHNFHFGNGDLIKVGTDDSVHVLALPQYNM